MCQSNISSNHKKGIMLPNNQPKHCSIARQKTRQKNEENGKEKKSLPVDCHFLLTMNKQKVCKTTIKCTFSKENVPGTFR